MLIHVDPDITFGELCLMLSRDYVLRPQIRHAETHYKLTRREAPKLQERHTCVCGNLVWPGEHPHCNEREAP